MSEFGDDVVIVTGAASGIGRAAAELMHSRGARVVIADINGDAASNVAANLGEGALATAVDVSNSASVASMVAVTVEHFGGIDVLCNNAGFGHRGTVVTTDEADWDLLMAVNLKGVFLCSKHAMPYLVASGRGRIVNTSSYTALVGIPDRAAYVASKGAISSLTRAMAIDHVSGNVRVNAVAPGTVSSPLIDGVIAAAADPTATRSEFNQRAPMNRMGAPSEIAEAIAWLASDRSSFATGSVLTIDGGSSAW
ncbi:SDR family oxidoreductase [Microbacterium rhizosphaerae]|uniref:SDR family oxidoreductase n=1 Tax=Microbacterium rhizosphaerae TaxID=1678237 RepID=UPI0031E8A0D0